MNLPHLQQLSRRSVQDLLYNALSYYGFSFKLQQLTLHLISTHIFVIYVNFLTYPELFYLDVILSLICSNFLSPIPETFFISSILLKRPFSFL